MSRYVFEQCIADAEDAMIGGHDLGSHHRIPRSSD
jgi:hypothetical protein